MSLLTRPLQDGATIYTFEKAGDVIPMHRHDAAGVHFMVVVRGRVALGRPAREPVHFSAGAVIDPGIEHEVTALEDNSRIVNIAKRP